MQKKKSVFTVDQKKKKQVKLLFPFIVWETVPNYIILLKM